MVHLSVRARFAAMIGNILVHYDTALFGLLAPFIAPLFFETSDPLTALILTYGMVPLGVWTRPLGSLFFGWFADRWGQRRALFYSLLGIAATTAGMGFLPTYSEVGVVAPCLLAAGRMLQSFCAAGESTGASIFVLENTPVERRSLMSSFYNVSTIGGMMVASGVITLLCLQGMEEAWWRVPFWLGGLTAVFGLFLRFRTPVEGSFKIRKEPWKFKEHGGAILSVMVVAGFSHVTYNLAFTLMNGFVPLVTSLSKGDVMKVNTALLAFDMVLLPCFGYLAHRFGKEKVMVAGALCLAIGAVPLFSCLSGAGIVMVTAVRCALVIFGVAFAAPYHAWKLERVPQEHRYTVLGIGSSLGAQLIGAPASVICLWLYQQLGYIWAPGIYLMALGSLAAAVVYKYAKSAASSAVRGA